MRAAKAFFEMKAVVTRPDLEFANICSDVSMFCRTLRRSEISGEVMMCVYLNGAAPSPGTRQRGSLTISRKRLKLEIPRETRTGLSYRPGDRVILQEVFQLRHKVFRFVH